MKRIENSIDGEMRFEHEINDYYFTITIGSEYQTIELEHNNMKNIYNTLYCSILTTEKNIILMEKLIELIDFAEAKNG